MTDVAAQVTPSKPPVWRDPRFRAIGVQLMAAFVVVWFFWTCLLYTSPSPRD